VLSAGLRLGYSESDYQLFRF